MSRQHDVLSQHAVVDATIGIDALFERAVEVRSADWRDDVVACGEPVDVLPEGDNFARHVGTWDHLVPCWKKVFGGGDGDVSVVQCYAADLDEDFVGTGGGDGFC